MDAEEEQRVASNVTAAVAGVVELCAVLVQRGAIEAADTENVEDVMLRALRPTPGGPDAMAHQRAQLQTWFQRLRSIDPIPPA